MAKVNHTTVVLNGTVQEIKDELTPIYGLKNILSAGLMLFGQLTADEQRQAIVRVNAVDKGESNREIIKEARTILKQAQKKGIKDPLLLRLAEIMSRPLKSPPPSPKKGSVISG